jgi:hypothetical protein
VQRAGFRRRYEKLGHMESLPIVPIAHSSYTGPVGDWDLKIRKGASDFGCLKDRWARFECKSRSHFLVLYLGSNPIYNGESDGKEEVAPMVGAGWKDIWSHEASPHGSNEKQLSLRSSAL